MLLSNSTSQELQKKISSYNISILSKPNDLSLWFIQGDDLIYFQESVLNIFILSCIVTIRKFIKIQECKRHIILQPESTQKQGFWKSS